MTEGECEEGTLHSYSSEASRGTWSPEGVAGSPPSSERSCRSEVGIGGELASPRAV